MAVMPPTNPAMLTPGCEAAPVLVWSLLLAVVVPVVTVALTELGRVLVELLLVSM